VQERRSESGSTPTGRRGAKAARLRLGRFRAKVLYVENIGEERRYSTEVRKVQSPTIIIQ